LGSLGSTTKWTEAGHLAWNAPKIWKSAELYYGFIYFILFYFTLFYFTAMLFNPSGILFCSKFSWGLNHCCAECSTRALFFKIPKGPVLFWHCHQKKKIKSISSFLNIKYIKGHFIFIFLLFVILDDEGTLEFSTLCFVSLNNEERRCANPIFEGFSMISRLLLFVLWFNQYWVSFFFWLFSFSLFLINNDENASKCNIIHCIDMNFWKTFMWTIVSSKILLQC